MIGISTIMRNPFALADLDEFSRVMGAARLSGARTHNGSLAARFISTAVTKSLMTRWADDLI
jgi:hypothetical protein